MKRIALYSLFIIAVMAAGLSAQDNNSLIDRKTEAELDKIFSHFNNSTPGVAVAIVKNGDVAYSKGFGMSNLEYDIPILPNSIFHIASISKQFTTMCVELLARQGKVSWEDDIRQYVEEVPDFGKKITLRHLANHTSGLRDQWELLYLSGWRREDLKKQEDVLELVSMQKELNFEPGSEYLYCNTGYTLLAVLVDRVTGMTMREFADRNIFNPLGMNRTHFHNDMMEIVKFRTSAYYPGKNGSYRISIPDFNTYGATSLFTTVEDLAKWEQNFVHKKVGGADGLRSLQTKGVLNNGEEINYALGISHGKYRGLKTVGHTGSDSGYRSAFFMFPDQKTSFIVFANVSNANPRGLAFEAADVLLEDDFTGEKQERSRRGRELPESVELSEKEMMKFAGTYYCEELDTKFKVIYMDGALYLDRWKYEPEKMSAKVGDLFLWDGDRLQFERGRRNSVTGFRLTSGRVRNLKFVKTDK